ncbi:MAG: hypothetical protein HWD63_01210 [Candidatus Parvibacillus calidus]|nr:MAG: hypothetical protein HWD63_01210 [Candidatus Parvibacillus calidus]
MKAWIAFLLYFLLLGNCHILKAQAINDDCFSATELTNVRSWCSSNGFFNNFSATPSGYGPATCFSSSGHDVWFSFTAIATDITILVKPGVFRSRKSPCMPGFVRRYRRIEL